MQRNRFILLTCISLLGCIIVITLGYKNDLWTKPLLFTQQKKANFHAPATTTGYYLPRHINNNLTLGPEQGIIIVSETSIIGKNARLTLLPGTTVAVHEYGSLVVQGSLQSIGTSTEPISYISNELREENRNWGGVLFEKESNGTIDHAIFHHASPGVSCQAPSTVSITNTTFSLGNLEIFGPCIYTP